VSVVTDVYGAYRAVLAEEAGKAPEEWTFKSNSAYRQILEHVTPEQGEQYIAVMQRDFPVLWRQLKRTFLNTAIANDSIGKPVRARFDSLGIECSPTNFRYMWQALAIVDHIRSLYLPPVTLIEIGGGYGGLALYLQWAFPDVVLSHVIIDLPEATDIQVAYACEFGLPTLSVESAQFHDWSIWSMDGSQFLVSAYGFSELDAETRAFYERTLIPECPHGFMVWNMIPVYTFTDAPLTVVDEDPLTGPGNKVVTW
jgi:hypothetical protein